MLLYSQTAEFRAIKTITSSNIPEEIRSQWLGQLGKEFFHYEPCLRAYQRIDTLARKRFSIIGFKALIEDPSLDEDMRDILANMSERPCKNKRAWRETFEILDRYRKIRIIYHAASETLSRMEESEVDIDTLMEENAKALAKAHSKGAEEEFILTFGKNKTSDGVIEDILNGKIIPRIPTGIKEYDDRSGGFPESGVIIIAATTSGGKSTVAMNVSKHMYLANNLSVLRVTLEMQELQETQRLFSHLTKIPLRKFTQNKLTMADKALIKRKYKAFTDHGEKHDIAYSTLSPKGGMTMDDVLRTAKPFGYKVLVVDYIGLLDGTDGEDQWRALNAAARVAKNYSRETGTLVILLAQLDDTTDKLRYARGIKEHADVMWQWNYTKPEQRESRLIPVIVSKDRDAELYAFDLAERFDIMTVLSGESAPEEDSTKDDVENDDAQKPRKGKKKKRPVDEEEYDNTPNALA